MRYVKVVCPRSTWLVHTSMTLRRQRQENFEFKATWNAFKATWTTGQGPREKAGSWEGERGRETEIHTDRDLPEKPE